MNEKHTTRTERDCLGDVKVPKNAYYGGFTARAKSNFQISDLTAPKNFMQALGIVKLAAAQTNSSLGLIDKKIQKALTKACDEFIEGKFIEEFTMDVFQAGAGTSYNMNANEIIANRANEILKKEKGKYECVNPNNHVNMAQSTNDVIPTATKIALLISIPSLLTEVQKLEKSLEQKAKKSAKLLKVARTHLQDAVPITMGQEWDAYKEALVRSREFIIRESEELKTLSIGGTAAGTGINTDPKYRGLMIKNLSKLTKIKLKSSKNPCEGANNFNCFMNFSGSIKSLALNLLNLCTNLKLMNMGPKAGLSEISLPEVQPGSSIMPGKINPSIPEAIEMVCMQVLGNDKVVELSASKSQFQLNVFCPIIMHNLLQSVQILTNGIRTLREKAIEGLRINEKHITNIYENSLCTATALTPYLGYAETADIVKAALKKGHSIKKEVLDRKLLKESELNKILSVSQTTKPAKKLSYGSL